MPQFIKIKHFVCYLSCCHNKVWDNSSLRKFISALTLKVQTIMAGKSGQQGLEGASSSASRVKKLRGTDTISQLAFFHSGCYGGSS